jgi:hypothetical protein
LWSKRSRGLRWLKLFNLIGYFKILIFSNFVLRSNLTIHSREIIVCTSVFVFIDNNMVVIDCNTLVTWYYVNVCRCVGYQRHL